MGKLAIKGHKTRGNEIIKILEVLGGSNGFEHTGKESNAIYYIDEINHCFITWTLGTISCNYKIFTLEEFLEKYPFKIGDRVCFSDDSNHYLTIERMWWNESSNDVECTFLEDAIDVSMKDLQPYKEEIMEEGEMLLGWVVESKGKRLIPHKDYEIKHDGEEFYLVKKKTQYPKNYVECVKILDCFSAAYIEGYKGESLKNLQKLLMYRDAYWKITMDWKPNWEDETNIYYTISYDGVNVKCYNNTDVYSKLAFPTEEIRDTFYVNFKDLIEECKEFI